MKAFITIIKNLIKYFFNAYGKAEPIKDEDDVLKSKKWLKKVIVLYSAFPILGMIIAARFIAPTISEPDLSLALLFPLMLLASWGFASMFLYFKQMIKVIFNAGKIGYTVGSQIKTTHVDVTHEYSNTYKVSSHTTNKGILFTIIAVFVGYMCYGYFCILIAPFLTCKKIISTVKNLQKYKAQNS